MLVVALTCSCTGSGDGEGSSSGSGETGGPTSTVGSSDPGSTAGEEEGSSTGFDVEVGDGRIEWVVAAGGIETDLARGLATCSDGTSVFTVGLNVLETVVFAAGTADEVSFEGHAFVASYRADGALRWALPLRGGFTNSRVEIEVHVVEPDCSVVLVGRYGGTSDDTVDELTIGTGTTPTLTGVTPGAYGWVEFVARLDAAGQLVDAAPTAAPRLASAIVDDTLVFATSEQISRVDLDGSVIWQQPIEVTSNLFTVLDVDVTADGIVLGGTWDNHPEPIVFDPGGPNEATLEGDLPTSNGEIFVAAYDADGAFLWAAVETSQYDDRVQSVVAFPDGSIGAAGEFSDGALYLARHRHQSQGFTRTLSPAGGGALTRFEDLMIAVVGSEDSVELADDLYPYELGLPTGPVQMVLAVDAEAVPRWLAQLPNVTVHELATDATGAVYAFGAVTSPVTFATDPPTALSPSGFSDLFLAKIVELPP